MHGRILSIVIGCGLPLCAQVSVPVLGVVFDAELNEVRELRGTPGATLLSEPLQPAGSTTGAAVPRGDWSVVKDPEGHWVLLRAGAAPRQLGWSAESVLVSTQGASVLLRQPGQAEVEVLAGLPEEATSRLRHSLNGAGEGTAEPVALADDGALAVRLNGRTYLLPADGSSAISIQAGERATLAFVPGGNTLVVADPGEQRGIFVLREGNFNRLADLHGDLQESLVLTANAQVALVGSTKSGRVQLIALNDGASRDLDCTCLPETARILTDRTFLLASRFTVPLPLLDLEPADPVVLWIPPPHSTTVAWPDAGAERQQ